MCQAQSSYSGLLDSESQQQMSHKKMTKPQSNKGWSEGVWTFEEKIRYVAFIFYNKSTLSSKLLRRASKVFKQMSNFIRTRNPAQCRSQNQKMYKRFKTITRIVTQFKSEIGEGTFNAHYGRLSEEPQIKFSTNPELRNCFLKEETVQPYRTYLSKEVAIQTENDHTILQPEERWMYEMFKLSMMQRMQYSYPAYVGMHPVCPNF